MNASNRSFILVLVFLTLPLLFIPALGRANPITLNFDDITVPYNVSYVDVPNGYGTLQWNNFGVFPGENNFGTGYYYGMVTPKNVAFDPYGWPASFSRSTPFDFNSAYLTAAYKSSMQIEVQGFAGSTLVYDKTYTIGDTSPTFINFNYIGVTEVNFIPPSSQFVIDNMSVTVPEGQSTWPVLIIALASLVVAIRFEGEHLKSRHD